MRQSKISGSVKGSDYKRTRKKAQPPMCTLYTVGHMGTNKKFKMKDGKEYFFDDNGNLRRVRG